MSEGMRQTPPAIRIPSYELQGKFNRNEGGYPARVNELASVCVHDELAHSRSGQPPGTRSKVYKYFEKDGSTVMVLHCFELPSGKLGASGKMDPKRLLVEGVIYFCD
jgi:hypothetical protein